jgi:hypothetical protein
VLLPRYMMFICSNAFLRDQERPLGVAFWPYRASIFLKGPYEKHYETEEKR